MAEGVSLCGPASLETDWLALTGIAWLSYSRSCV